MRSVKVYYKPDVIQTEGRYIATEIWRGNMTVDTEEGVVDICKHADDGSAIIEEHIIPLDLVTRVEVNYLAKEEEPTDG
jgi:hypothetical protein